MPDSTTDNSGTVYYRRLLSYAFVYWKVFAFAVVGMVLAGATDAAIAAFMKPLMDQGLVERDMETIRQLPLLLIGIFLVRVFAMFISMYGMSWVGRMVILRLRDEMFDRLLVLPSSYYDRATTGEIISRFTYDVEQVANASTKAITVVIRDTFAVLALLAWMFYLSVILTLVLLTVGPLIAWLVMYVSKKFRKLSRRIQGSIGSVSRIVEEAVSAQLVVKLYGGRRYEAEQFSRINDQNRRQHMRLIATQALSSPIIRLIVGIALAGIIYIATMEHMAEIVTPGMFASYMVSITMLFAPVKRLSDVNAELQRGIAAAESVFGFTDLDSERNEGRHATERARGDIEIEQVSFRYAGVEEYALRDVSLRISAGETIAFVGRSGSGKSTLLSLLPRLYDPESGAIRLDGTDLREYRLENLRAQFAYVGQDVVLFNDTIAHNIGYGAMRDRSMEDIIQAARAAYADAFIQELPQGYDTVVGERGTMLSGGQRQRIAIARALLNDAPVLILDEATSALDTESERYIQASLEQLMQHRTTLVIAHRLSTIENADRIVVLDDGCVVEVGDHRALLEQSGHYASLHRMQFREDAGRA